jgi:ribosome-associated protein
VTSDQVADELLRRARWSSSRSSGPGGQRRDKVETRAELVLESADLAGLDAELAGRLATGLGLYEGPLRITAQDDRLLSRNRELAAERLRALVAAALASPPPERRQTRPSRSARAARTDAKTRRGTIKALRQPPEHD